MKSTVSIFDFRDAFSIRKDNFSYEGLGALFDYLEELEMDMDEEMELDPIAFCCAFTEYDSLEELKENYTNIETMEELEENTMVIPVEGKGFIIRDF